MPLPKTDKVTAFKSGGTSGTVSIAIPREVIRALGIKAGDRFQAVPAKQGKRVFVVFERLYP